MSSSTITRIFGTNGDLKTGPEIENAEKIVKALSEDNVENEKSIRDRVYRIIYSPDVVEDKLQEYERMEKAKRHQKENALDGNTEEASGSKEDTIVKEDEVEIVEQREVNLQKVQEAIETILNVIGYKIVSSKESETWPEGIKYIVNNPKIDDYMEIMKQPYIDVVMGIWLSDKNYEESKFRIGTVAKTPRGVMILCCESMEVFKRARADQDLKIKNNVLLYLDDKSTLVVKSHRKKSFLKEVFGKNNLLFPEN